MLGVLFEVEEGESELRRKLILLAEAGTLNTALALLGVPPRNASGVVDDELVAAVKRRIEEWAC